jgi:phosphoglycerate-specific signal transduction histidine kinase
MRIPFFSKKTKNILKDNENRIFLLTKEEQEKILVDPKIKIEEKLKQLLNEVNELKVLHDDLQEELAKKILHGKDVVIEIGKGYWLFHSNIKVLKDSRIQIKKDWEATIGPETTFTGKIPGFFKTKQFRSWFVESEGEYTYDPRDETPIEVKKKNEGLLEIGHLMSKKQLGASLIEDLGSKIQKWWQQLGVPIIISVIIFLFLLFMGMFFGQYNFTKAG